MNKQQYEKEEVLLIAKRAYECGFLEGKQWHKINEPDFPEPKVDPESFLEE
jgi:hypothetical protein